MSVPYIDGRTLTNAQRRDRADFMQDQLYRKAGSLGVLGIGIVTNEDPCKVKFADGTHDRIEFMVPVDIQKNDIVLVGQVGRYQVIVSRIEPLFAMEGWD